MKRLPFRKTNLLYVVMLFLLYNLLFTNSLSAKEAIKFAVMGHVHSWFKSIIVPEMNKLNTKNLDFLFFTGDVVVNSTEKNWKMVRTHFKNKNYKIFISPGNHDLTFTNKKKNEGHTNINLYEKFNGETYSSFVKNNSLFIILNTPSAAGLGDKKYLIQQKIFINKILSNLENINNIFVFSHYLAFVTDQGKYSCLKGHIHFDNNSNDENKNIWLYLEKKLKKTKIKTILFAGDLGVDSFGSRIQIPAFYDKYDNIEIIAGGMGNPKQHYLIVKVKDGVSSVTMIPFDKNRSFKLTDFTLENFNFCSNKNLNQK